MPYTVLHYPNQPIPIRCPLYRATNFQRSEIIMPKHSSRRAHTTTTVDGNAFRGVFFAVLFDIILVALGFGLWEILAHIL